MGIQRFALVFFVGILAVCGAATTEWKDPSPQRTSYIPTAPGVKIETLDWGGQGRPLVLIPGFGSTAHVFDDFAQKLTAHFHVYGVTRRGYGRSSRPKAGYDIDRLGDDVVAVIRALKLQKPILVGHSFGGQEVSDVATRYPDLIAGAVYLDAVYTYDAASEKQALYWNVEWRKQLERLQKHLSELLDAPFNPKDVSLELHDTDLPAAQAIVENLIKVENGRPLWVDPGPDDLASATALREWYHRMMRVYLPEAEFRETQTVAADGRLSGADNTPEWVGTAVQAGRKAFHHIDVPALYIGAEDNVPRDYDKNDPKGRANAEAYKAYQHGWIVRRTEHFTTDAPKGRLIILSGASHEIFASNPTDVTREIQVFADSLPP